MEVLNEAKPKVEYKTKMSNIVPTKKRAVEKMIVTKEKNRPLKSNKDTDFSRPGAIARSVAMSILVSGASFHEDLVMKLFLRPFVFFR